MLGEQQFDGIPQHRVDTDWSTCKVRPMITADETAVFSLLPNSSNIAQHT